jgi:hypothetical protein
MKIDITREPPADIFQHRRRYLLGFIVFLILVSCSLFLMVYEIVSDMPQNKKLEDATLGFFVVSGVFFSFFGAKMNHYKRLGPKQKKELDDLGRKHPEIATYCALVEKQGREPIWAEYEACEDWK